MVKSNRNFPIIQALTAVKLLLSFRKLSQLTKKSAGIVFSVFFEDVLLFPDTVLSKPLAHLLKILQRPLRCLCMLSIQQRFIVENESMNE